MGKRRVAALAVLVAARSGRCHLGGFGRNEADGATIEGLRVHAADR